MRNTQRGATVTQALLLLLFLALLVGLFYFINGYGKIGRVAHLDFATRDYIAYIRQDKGKTDLCLVRADGTDRRNMTSDGAPKRAPAWSPNGKQICYAAEVEEDRFRTTQVYLLGAGGPQQATYGSTGKDRPEWSPDGKWIAYLSGGSVKIVAPNGADGRQVYPPPHKGSAQDAENNQPDTDATRKPPITTFRWAANSLAIAGIQESEGEYANALGSSNWWKPAEAQGPAHPSGDVAEPEAVVVLPSIDGATVMMLPGADRTSFCWMPDSKRVIVALSSSDGLSAIQIYRVDEKDLPPDAVAAAGKGTVTFENPAVAPDGSRLAVEVWRTGATVSDREPLGIAVIPLSDRGAIAIRAPADIARVAIVIKGAVREPKWSPDGTRLVYRLQSAAGHDLCVANADGTGVVNLTKGDGDASFATWSPAR